MGTVGRPRALDAAKQSRFCALISLGCDLRKAAAGIGCTARTVRREANRNATFKDDWDSAELSAFVAPLKTLKEAASENWKAATWYVERVYPNRFVKRPVRPLSQEESAILFDGFLDHLIAEIPDRETRNRVLKRMERLLFQWLRDWEVCRKIKPVPVDPSKESDTRMAWENHEGRPSSSSAPVAASGAPAVAPDAVPSARDADDKASASYGVDPPAAKDPGVNGLK